MVSREQSDENLAKLGDPNRGRIVFVIRSEDGVSVRVITGNGGRSDLSKNRKFILLDDLNGNGPYVRTEVFNRGIIHGEAAATLYDAQRAWGGWHVASNGEQTGYIAAAMADGRGLEGGQRHFTHEGPKNFNTPRITVAFNQETALTAYLGQILPHPDVPANIFSSIRLEHGFGDRSDRSFGFGEGYFTATYDGRGGVGTNYEQPWGLLMPGSLEDNMDLIWEAWDSNTRGNLCGKEVVIGSDRFKYAFKSIHPVEYDPDLLVFSGRAA